MSIPAQIDVVFSGEEKFICGLQDETAFTVSMGEAFLPEEYHGSVDITATTSVQVLETQGKLLADNIIIEPIPDNYGLITWNGSTLTVS